MQFEWDDTKDLSNPQKPGPSFSEVTELVIPDTNHALPFAKTDVVIDSMGDFFDRQRL